jgi:hypothetical protein
MTKRGFEATHAYGFLNGITFAEGDAQVSSLSNSLRGRLWLWMSGPWCNNPPRLLLAAILLVPLTGNASASPARPQNAQGVSESKLTKTRLTKTQEWPAYKRASLSMRHRRRETVAALR